MFPDSSRRQRDYAAVAKFPQKYSQRIVKSTVRQLSIEQRELVSMLGARLGALQGVKAVVLGGSHARGMAQAGSDIDLGILYSELEPFSIQSVREIAEELSDTPGPVVTGLYEWGQWVNGGAWLTIGQQRVDFLYRCLEQVERVIAEAEAGRYELDYAQQPPFGFFSGTYLGEVATCLPVFDPGGWVEKLKRRVAEYPEALRRSVVQEQLWSAEFDLSAFARKFAARGDGFGTAACLTRAVNQMVLALFALNRKYLINDKTALLEIAGFERVPREFGPRVQITLAGLGDSAASLGAAVESIETLLCEIASLAGELYKARYSFPK